MTSDNSFMMKHVSPMRCKEKPWDQWVSEIGHISPVRDEDGPFATPQEKVNLSSRRVHESHPYKVSNHGYKRYRRSGLNRLKNESMSLHGLFPQIDSLNAVVCHMCGVIVKCSAAYRHLIESHSSSEPILPPPPAPTVKLKLPSRKENRHKRETNPPPVDFLPVKMETSPIHNNHSALSRVVLPHSDMKYLDDVATPTTVPEVQVCVESGELPVVSIQDTEELPLGENTTDDIFAIMNSEGIQSAEDITNAADWKNIIKDIGNMPDIDFTQTTDSAQTNDLFTSVDTSTLAAYAITDADLSNIQFAPTTQSMLQAPVIEETHVNPPVVKPVVNVSSSTTSKSRLKTPKTKFHLREYDPNKHCGVITSDNPKPCKRSLTCKAHTLSLRRMVEGRSKPFDTLLAEHRASRDPNANAINSGAPTQQKYQLPTATTSTVPLATPHNIPPLLVNTSMTKDLTSFINGLTSEQQVNDIYASLLNVEDPNLVLPDTSSITSLLSQSLPNDILLPDDAETQANVSIKSVCSPVEVDCHPKADQIKEEGLLTLEPSNVCWYLSSPRPLALCTFNASHAGGAITLGKRFASVRSNIKSSLSRSQCKSAGSSKSYSYNPNSVSLSKSVHMSNSNKSKPEVRKLIVTCSATSGQNKISQDNHQTSLSDLFSTGSVGDLRHTLNGHIMSNSDRKYSSSVKHKSPTSSVLDLGFSLDPLLADEKC